MSKTKNTNIFLTNRCTTRIALIVGIILLIPLILSVRDGGTKNMGWNWTLSDFIVMGALLFCAGLALDFMVKKLTRPVYQILSILTIIIAFLLIWIELAVGIFGTPFSGS